MRMMLAAMMLALLSPMTALAAQGPRIPAAEQEADRIESNTMYELQRERDRKEAQRIETIKAQQAADYQAALDRDRADYEAKMAAWRDKVARDRADYEAKVARCLGGDRTACAPAPR